jgi:hypothetical protein
MKKPISESAEGDKVMLSLLGAVSAALLIYWLGRIILPDDPIIVVGCALFLGFITWIGIEKLLVKRQKRKDGPDIFPLLKKDALEKWGSKWGEQYEHLNKVVLYDPPLKYPIDSRYILYFDIDTSTPEGEKSEEIFNEINAFQSNAILSSGFKEVYRNKPESQFRDEWFLSIVKYSGFDDKYSWVIYQREKRDQSNQNLT